MGMLERLANQAIFQMQLNTSEAVCFIRTQCPKATPEQAQGAISEVTLWYKK